MCTALVVRDQYWQSVLDFQCKMANIEPIKLDEVRRIKNVIILWAEEVGKAIRRVLDIIWDAIGEIAIVFEDTVEKTLASLQRLWDECHIEPFDDPDIILDKLENRFMYLHQQQSIREQQYYRNCFKLAKMHPCIMNHDRR